MQKINKYEILFIFLIFPFIRLEAFTHISIIDKSYDILKLLNSIIILFLSLSTFFFKKNKRIDKFILRIFLLCGVIFLSVLMHDESINIFLIRYISVLSLCLVVYYAERKEKIKFLISGIKKFFKILILLNFITLLLFPEGIWQDIRVREGMLESTIVEVNLLGKANATTPILLSMILIIFLCVYFEKKKMTKIDKIIEYITYFSIILQKSATGIVGLLVYFIIVYIYKNKKFKNFMKKLRINYIVFLWFALAGTIGVCIFNIQEFFVIFIELVLKKDVTLSNRINVWAMCINYIKNNFSNIDYMMGQGAIEYSKLVFNGRYAHCHNQFMDIFLQGGFLGLIFYIGLFKIALEKISNLKNDILVFIAAIIISFVVMFIAEVYITPLIYFSLYLVYVSQKNLIINKEDIER